jgi:hypothetical protein
MDLIKESGYGYGEEQSGGYGMGRGKTSVFEGGVE